MEEIKWCEHFRRPIIKVPTLETNDFTEELDIMDKNECYWHDRNGKAADYAKEVDHEYYNKSLYKQRYVNNLLSFKNTTADNDIKENTYYCNNSVKKRDHALELNVVECDPWLTCSVATNCNNTINHEEQLCQEVCNEENNKHEVITNDVRNSSDNENELEKALRNEFSNDYWIEENIVNEFRESCSLLCTCTNDSESGKSIFADKSMCHRECRFLDNAHVNQKEQLSLSQSTSCEVSSEYYQPQLLSESMPSEHCRSLPRERSHSPPPRVLRGMCKPVITSAKPFTCKNINKHKDNITTSYTTVNDLLITKDNSNNNNNNNNSNTMVLLEDDVWCKEERLRSRSPSPEETPYTFNPEHVVARSRSRSSSSAKFVNEINTLPYSPITMSPKNKYTNFNKSECEGNSVKEMLKTHQESTAEAKQRENNKAAALNSRRTVSWREPSQSKFIRNRPRWNQHIHSKHKLPIAHNASLFKGNITSEASTNALVSHNTLHTNNINKFELEAIMHLNESTMPTSKELEHDNSTNNKLQEISEPEFIKLFEHDTTTNNSVASGYNKKTDFTIPAITDHSHHHSGITIVHNASFVKNNITQNSQMKTDNQMTRQQATLPMANTINKSNTPSNMLAEKDINKIPVSCNICEVPLESMEINNNNKNTDEHTLTKNLQNYEPLVENKNTLVEREEQQEIKRSSAQYEDESNLLLPSSKSAPSSFSSSSSSYSSFFSPEELSHAAKENNLKREQQLYWQTIYEEQTRHVEYLQSRIQKLIDEIINGCVLESCNVHERLRVIRQYIHHLSYCVKLIVMQRDTCYESSHKSMKEQLFSFNKHLQENEARSHHKTNGLTNHKTDDIVSTWERCNIDKNYTTTNEESSVDNGTTPSPNARTSKQDDCELSSDASCNQMRENLFHNASTEIYKTHQIQFTPLRQPPTSPLRLRISTSNS